MLAIFRRELNAYFSSAIGYVFLVAFYLFTALPFTAMMLSYTSDLAAVYNITYYILMIFVPILTMRLFSEERKQKTDQAL